MSLENLAKILEAMDDNPVAKAVMDIPPTPFDPDAWGAPHKRDPLLILTPDPSQDDRRAVAMATVVIRPTDQSCDLWRVLKCGYGVHPLEQPLTAKQVDDLLARMGLK